MLAHQLRQKYLDFFVSKEHLVLPGAPLVPVDALGNLDTSTLFTSAGMQQFKPYFIGAAIPPKTRIATVQKCLRTNDIDSVGDYSHCTLFEMLGNFSFGDYFKGEVIPWTWDFLTNVVGVDGDRLCVTVFEDDDEAFAIWRDVIGLTENRIHRLPESKNYWPANAISEGPNGPCGPCSEIFYRVAPLEEMTSTANLTPTQRYLIDDDAGRYLEVWNNVFTQFDRAETADGKPLLNPLPKKNNDTGAGFDRIAYVIQGKKSVFETDLFQPTLEQIGELSKRNYGGSMSPVDFAFRVVAEHIRSMTFCIADGILPSNEGRGYVLRYIMRRAVRYGKMVLGFEEPFLHDIAPKIIASMGDFYTELKEREELILRTIFDEEERFRRTLDTGLTQLRQLLKTEKVETEKILPGKDAFTLYDTYGFPLRLTEEIVQEAGLTVDLAGFDKAMEAQRHRSREASGEQEVFGAYRDALLQVSQQNPPTEFLGYTELSASAKILAIIQNGALVQTASASPNSVEVILDRTPFYAESGGQVGDTGILRYSESDTVFTVDVADTKKVAGYFLHVVNINDGTLQVGREVHAEVNREQRLATMRNHTATHLLQAALRKVLGGHVYQKGSSVSPERLRFDFTHSSPMTDAQIHEIEEIVHAQSLADTGVIIHTDIPVAEAKERGAMALFGEKYGDKVRMVEVPGCSLELCGGTHLNHTSQVGLCKIVAETGVAAGVRRIEAVTGSGAYAYVNRKEETLAHLAGILKTNVHDVATVLDKLISQNRELTQQVRQLKSGQGVAQVAELAPNTVSGIAVVCQAIPAADVETLSNLADRTAQHLGSAVVVLGSVNEGKVTFVAKVTADLLSQGLHAGNLVREVAKIAGGGGGGRPDFAQAGGRNPDKLEEALASVPALVTAQKR
ncbi:alanine--tRNA ligase [Armatimonadota bacterium]|nr:alanine--tRNA ligase [Armatimonadota bacterium]